MCHKSLIEVQKQDKIYKRIAISDTRYVYLYTQYTYITQTDQEAYSYLKCKMDLNLPTDCRIDLENQISSIL